MKLAQYTDHTGLDRVGLVADGHVHPIEVPDSLTTDETVIGAAMGDIPIVRAKGEAPALGTVKLAPPLRQPPALRDFLLFEAHLRNALIPRARDIPQQWYVAPSFYFGNPHTICGHGDSVSDPGYGGFDFELELGVVIGRRLADCDPEEAEDAIAGFTLFNDFSLRDVQAKEHVIGLGPTKSKDFATALGPVLVTPDELPGPARKPRIQMSAWVNGQLKGGGSTTEMHFDLAEALAHAARNSVVLPGEVVGSGTIPTGCILEARALDPNGDHPWLRSGDVVRLEAEGIGALETNIVDRRS